MTKKPKPSSRRSRQRASRPQGSGAAGYIVSVLISAVLTCVFLVALLAALRPDALDALAVAQAVATPTPIPAGPDAPPADTPAPAQQPAAAIRSNQAVNVRSGPGTGFGPIAVAQPGTAVTIIGQDDAGGWYNVRLPNSVEGWVAAELLALDGAAGPDQPAPAPTEATPEPVVCDPDDLRAWWGSTVPAYYQMMFTLDQLGQQFEPDDYQHLFDAARAAYRTFDDAQTPACVAPAQAELLRGFDETLAAVRDAANNNTPSANNRARAARSAMTTALAVLAAEQNLVPNATGCGAEFWNTGIAPDIDRVFALVGSVDTNTSALTDLRTTVFELQRVRRYLGKLNAPDCVRLANDSLLNGVDSYISMYQSAATGDRTAAANANAAATGQINTFRVEMRKLGL